MIPAEQTGTKSPSRLMILQKTKRTSSRRSFLRSARMSGFVIRKKARPKN